MIRPLPILLMLPLAAALADTVELKSGEIIEGKIVDRNLQSLTIEVQFSPTIIDERVIPGDEVAHYVIDSGDEAAFEKIRDLKTPDTVLDPKKCEAVVTGELQPFLKKFPKSPRVHDVEQQIRAIQHDIARLKDGEVRVAGAWYGRSSFAAEKYQIEAAAVLENLKDAFAAHDYPAALNLYEELQHRYPESIAWAESVPLAQKSVTKLLQQLNLEIENLPVIKTRRQAAIDRTPIEQRQPVQQAIAAENARALAIAAAAQKEGRRFFPLIPYDEKGLKAMQVAAQEIDKQLETIDLKALAHRAFLVRMANKELDHHQLEGAETTLAGLKEEWPAYEALSRMEQRLQLDLDARKSAAEKASKK